MKALSVKPHWAAMIAAGLKTLEIRSRPTHHRGMLLICASLRPAAAAAAAFARPGHAACVVHVVGCRPFTRADSAAACIAYQPDLWAWELAGARPVEPFPVTGRLSFFPIDDSLIKPASIA